MARRRRRDRDEGTAGGAQRIARLTSHSAFLPLLTIAALLMGVVAFDGKLALSGDNAEFIVLGRSLAAGQGLSYINQPTPDPATKYPFGFPLMLAALQRAFPGSLGAPKLFVVLLYALGLPLVFRLLGRDASARAAAAVVCLYYLLSPLLLEYAHQIMSEVPFLAATTLALILTRRAAESRDSRDLLWALLASMSAYYIRTAGVALLGATVAYFAITGRRRQSAAFAVGALLLAAPWAIRNHLHGAGAGYVGQFVCVDPYRPQDGTLTVATLVERIVDNLRIYGLRDLPAVFFPSRYADPALPTGLVALLVGGAVAGLLLVGLHAGIRQRQLWSVYLATYLLMCLLWPQVWSGLRFLLPVVPLICYSAVNGLNTLLRALRERLSPRVLQLGGLLLLLVSLASNAQATVWLGSRPDAYPQPWRNYLEAGRWIRSNSPPGHVVACRKPFLMYVFANRRTVGYRFTSVHSEVIEGLEANGVDLVVVFPFTRSSRDYLLPAIRAHGDRFQPVHLLKDPDTAVLSFRR